MSEALLKLFSEGGQYKYQEDNKVVEIDKSLFEEDYQQLNIWAGQMNAPGYNTYVMPTNIAPTNIGPGPTNYSPTITTTVGTPNSYSYTITIE